MCFVLIEGQETLFRCSISINRVVLFLTAEELKQWVTILNFDLF